MEFLTSEWLWWLIAALLMFLIELSSGMTIGLSLGIGCTVSMLLSFTGLPLEWQIVSAIIVAAIVFVIAFVIPSSKRNRKNNHALSTSNMDAIIGRTATVTEKIKGDGTYGRVKIDGDLWQAVTIDNEAVEVGASVEVVSFDSIILNVKPINK